MMSAALPPSRGPALVWFRDDLRIADHPALTAAAAGGRPVVGLFVLDEASEGVRPLGGAAKWWLAGALRALAASLARFGVPLVFRRGRAGDVVPAVARETGAAAVVWTRRYGGAERAIDRMVQETLRGVGVHAEGFEGRLLYEPWAVTGRSGGALRVFTPFWRAATGLGEPRAPLPVPPVLVGAPAPPSEDLDSWGLEPTRPDWAGGLRATWTRGEEAGRTRLAAFVEDGLAGYADGRDRPADRHVSRLSPYLRHGEVSPHQAWHAACHAVEAGRVARRDFDKFASELGWREFAYHLLFHHPDLAARNVQARFDGFPFVDDPAARGAWQRGETGYPIVDAGMRQLWRTGWLHNRARLIVASFLIKHLLQDWRRGEAWFWDTLVDADPANNAASWQWVAGSGADAAPYFRIFNPVLQGEKFDPDGAHVRAFVPELARLPAAFVHKPWLAPPSVLAAAGVTLGSTYPRPLVDHGTARTRALAAFQQLAAAE